MGSELAPTRALSGCDTNYTHNSGKGGACQARAPKLEKSVGKERANTGGK